MVIPAFSRAALMIHPSVSGWLCAYSPPPYEPSGSHWTAEKRKIRRERLRRRWAKSSFWNRQRRPHRAWRYPRRILRTAPKWSGWLEVGRDWFQKENNHHSSHGYTGNHRRQKQDHPKGSDKDEIQLPQSAACPTVWRIAAPSESTAGVESKTMRAFLLQKIHRLYLCQRDRWTCEARISHTAFSADSAKERYAEDSLSWSAA